MSKSIVTVFGSSRPLGGSAAYEDARRLGRLLAEAGFAVCSGGYGGVMEAVSRGAREAGGHTLGVTAEFFNSHANRWVVEEIRVRAWQERLFKLIELGEGYVAMPGGTGTLVELAVVWEMLNKGVLPRKPFVAVGDFWGDILHRVRSIERADPTGPWGEANQELVHLVASPEEAVAFLERVLKSRNA